VTQKYVLFRENPSGAVVAINPDHVCFVGGIDERRSLIVFGRDAQVTAEGSVEEILVKLEESGAPSKA